MAIRQSIGTGILWTRTFTLLSSIGIIIASLSVYSINAIPVASILRAHNHDHLVVKEMIQDRRLICTLVAAQVSVFCPLYMLVQQHPPRRTILDVICQFFMPIGLALSWIFCILFDRKTALQAAKGTSADWFSWFTAYDVCLQAHGTACTMMHLISGFKHAIAAVLIVEVLLIWLELLVNVVKPAKMPLACKEVNDEEKQRHDLEYSSS
ncbi:uncharacterized protein BYT42DRAFT_568713 [Radiomyces spectabilis]|uniref:uncharacterized protein n=1 Tax=Radiomyces spectabilis TaxID=64574 RepID=UPI00221EB615|nr:uncharacterized protein BYT42DRAFT_568713 [Radiomyces spectabilis]KAI8379416.1 hypothetical protein BYT42DRAFT_568713 [Radiomyces spectabilis]